MAGDMKKPRVSEIAKLAGVSTATVSKVINGREGVSSSTRARIEKIMEESGYSKSLVTTKTSQTIELVLTEVMANGINAMIAETTEYVKSMPIGITITQTGRGKRSEESFREILNRNPLGVILLLSNATEREKTLLRSRNIPFVIIDSIGEGSQDTLGVGIDNWTGGLIATEHLIKLGHQRIGIITGPQNAESAQARYSGYATALRRAGIQLDPELVAYGDTCRNAATSAHANCSTCPPPNGRLRSSHATTSRRSTCTALPANAACPCPLTCRSSASTTCTRHNTCTRRSPPSASRST